MIKNSAFIPIVTEKSPVQNRVNISLIPAFAATINKAALYSIEKQFSFLMENDLLLEYEQIEGLIISRKQNVFIQEEIYKHSCR